MTTEQRDCLAETSNTQSVIVTRMPTTGKITNVQYSGRSVDQVRQAWSDMPYVEIYSVAKYQALPRCPTCRNWTAFGYCDDCR